MWIFSWTPLQQSLIWAKKKFSFLPSVTSKCVSCWFLPATFSRTASRNIKSLPAEKKSFTFSSCQWQIAIFLFIPLPMSLASAVCPRDLLRWKSPKTVSLSWVCWLSVLLEQIVCPSLLLRQSSASTTKSQMPFIKDIDSYSSFAAYHAPQPGTISGGPCHLAEDPQPATRSEAKARHLEEYVQKARLLSCNQSQDTPPKLFTQSPRKHGLLHSQVASVFMPQGMGRASFRGEEQGSVWSPQC